MTNFLKRFIQIISVGAAGLVLTLATQMSPVQAKDGSDIYNDVCIRCHGKLAEQSSWKWKMPKLEPPIVLAVVTPQGPTLSGIIGRPVGIIEAYLYSKGMRKFAETGAVWDRATLDQFLTNSRKFVQGTYMIVKLEEQDRQLVLDYLERVARYRP